MKSALVILALLFSLVARATDPADSVARAKATARPWYVPDYVAVQYAGNIGWLSGGVGFATRRDHFQQSFVYGYTPPAISGVRVHTVTSRSIFHIHRFDIDHQSSVIPYVAAAVSLEVGGRSFFTTPSNMPDEYYHFPKSIHLIPALGLKHRRMTRRMLGLKGVEIFGELSTVDVYVYYKMISREAAFHEITSFSVGVHLLR